MGELEGEKRWEEIMSKGWRMENEIKNMREERQDEVLEECRKGKRKGREEVEGGEAIEGIQAAVEPVEGDEVGEGMVGDEVGGGCVEGALSTPVDTPVSPLWGEYGFFAGAEKTVLAPAWWL